MNVTAEERIMYSVMKAVYDSGIPISFKGSMVLKACLFEVGFLDETRHTVDIDANWNTDTPPTAEQMVESLQRAINRGGMDYEVRLYRMYGEKRSAGFELVDRNTDEILFTMDVDVNRPITPTQIYEVDGICFRGVSPLQMIADKVAVVSTDKVFRRIKDVVDLYYISKVFEFDVQNIYSTLKCSERTMGDFQGFLQRKEDLRHSYDKFRFAGGVNKPPFDAVYREVKIYLNLEQLDQDTEALQAIGRARGCQFNILRYQQEDALNTVLPLGLKRIDATRTLTTECTAVLMPFKSQEIQDAGGIYYGVNAVSHNLIICNRGNLLNGNGFITGVSGSGKSMAAKQEMTALALSTDHDIIIVDPEREYGELVRALGGEVITISASDPNGCHINALDLSEGYGDGKEPLVMKSEFIMSLYEQLMGADKIEPQEKSIIDRSVGNIYREYLKNYQGKPPTLKNLYDDLMKQVNPEAHRIALALELFTVGSLNVFSHQTNINTKSRILCFDIQDLGENLKSVGLLVMLDAIYNRVIQNRREGKYTHVYIDEIYLFFANGSGSGHSITNYSSEFLYKCWKRFRKYGAMLTGITQNVEECLLSNTARMMFANSEFLLMLNQATTDREQLARLLGASDTQMSYVDNAPAGHGLIKVGGAIVPFANELPKNTELYRLMSTRPGED